MWSVEKVYPYNNYVNQNYYNIAYGCQQRPESTNTAPVDEIKETQGAKKVNKKHSDTIKEVPYNPAFSASALRTQLVNNDEINKYNDLQKILDKHTKKELESLLKSGILLDNDSSDGTSVLDNIHKIATTPRAQGLNPQSLAKDVINTLNNPYLITQQFGDIPVEKRAEAIQAYLKNKNTTTTDNNAKIVAMNDINVTHSGTCVAASIEFNLAQAQPAEFARFAEGLTSPNNSVSKEIHLDKLADNTLDAIWLLNAFEIPFKTDNFYKATLKFKPDENAIVRAQIQTNYKDSDERTPVDVMMQSTFMQVGSQQSYNSLSDKRHGKFNQNDKGLIEFEKTFVESVVEDKNKISMTYQNVDENARLIGYETDMNTLKKHLTQSIDMGENVIIGYTQTDENNIIINGHEITVVGYRTDPKNGKMTFICNDTDDNETKAIEYSEDYLLPKIHHAALPKSVIQNDIKLVENWTEGLKLYKELKKQEKENNNSQINISSAA